MTPPEKHEERDRVMTHDEAVDLVAAYALDALDHADRGPFEAHLALCVACRRQLVVFRRVSAGVGLGVEPIEPPPDLRARTLANATKQPQRRAESALTSDRSTASRSRPFVSPWLAAAAGLALAAGLGIYAWSLRTQLSDAQRMVTEYSTRIDSLRDQMVAVRRDSVRLVNTIEVMRAPDVIKVTLKGQAEAAAGSGRAYISASRGLIVEMEHMPVLPAGKVYQLWVIPPGASQIPVSAGVFNVNPTGATSLALPVPAGVTATQVLAVTVEEGPNGVLRPTNTPIMLGTAGQ